MQNRGTFLNRLSTFEIRDLILIPLKNEDIRKEIREKCEKEKFEVLGDALEFQEFNEGKRFLCIKASVKVNTLSSFSFSQKNQRKKPTKLKDPSDSLGWRKMVPFGYIGSNSYDFSSFANKNGRTENVEEMKDAYNKGLAFPKNWRGPIFEKVKTSGSGSILAEFQPKELFQLKCDETTRKQLVEAIEMLKFCSAPPPPLLLFVSLTPSIIIGHPRNSERIFDRRKTCGGVSIV